MTTAPEVQSLVGQNVLVTCDNYFFAPNGQQYRAVFGKLINVLSSEEALGIKVNIRSQDRYMTVGNMRIAGCQIHYVIATDECHAGPAIDHCSGDRGFEVFERPSAIYFAKQKETP